MYKYLSILLLVGCLVQCSTKKTSNPNEFSSVDSTQHTPIITTAALYDSFGTATNKFQVDKFKLQSGGSLYNVLERLNFTPEQIYHIAEKAEPVVDFGAFRPGQKFRAYYSKKNHVLEKLVWQPNALQYVTFSWVKNSLHVYWASRIKKERTHTVSGTIESSLYNAISDDNSRGMLVHNLTEVLAWEIDFTTLRKGDSFRILYNKTYVNGQFFDTGRILAIELNHRGETYFAYYFNNGKIDGYYDENGNSVQKALLKLPFKYNHRITSGFNMHRVNPVLHRKMPHTGVDYAAPVGTPVLATGSGVVLEAHYGGAAGNIVKVKHNSTYTTAYMHLSKFAGGIHRGVHVDQGEVIGYSGATGRVTGPNLHYSVYVNGNAVNPLNLDLPPAKSISQKYMLAFKKSRNKLNKKLFSGESNQTKKETVESHTILAPK